MDNSFKALIDKGSSILILLPLKPTLDQVASGLSLYLAIRDERDVHVYSPSPMIVEFNRLVGINKISTDMGNKNLLIEFSDYKATDIERVSYDIKDGQFKLTVIPKQRVAPPGKDSVNLSYSGINCDTVIMIGGLNESHFPAISDPELADAATAHIGISDLHLPTGKNYISFSRPASSISEVVASLIKEIGLPIDEDVATNLILGIESTTNYFSHTSVTADTFQVISDLMKLGGKRSAKPFPGNTQSIAPTPGSFPTPIKPKSQTIFGKAPSVQNNNKSGSSQAPNDWLEPKIYKGTSVS